MKNSLLKVTLCFAIASMGASLGACTPNQPRNSNIEVKNPLYFSGDIRYEDESRIKPEILAECVDIKSNLVASLRKQSNKNRLPLSDQKQERQLTIEIVNATPGVFVFGNMGSVPAMLDIKFSVAQGEEIILQEDRHCQTNLAGFLGLQPSACNKLERCAKNHGKYIAERVSRILYQ